MVKRQGPDHLQKFTMRVRITDVGSFDGSGMNKKAAKQACAKVAVEYLEKTEFRGSLFGNPDNNVEKYEPPPPPPPFSVSAKEKAEPDSSIIDESDGKEIKCVVDSKPSQFPVINNLFKGLYKKESPLDRGGFGIVYKVSMKFSAHFNLNYVNFRQNIDWTKWCMPSKKFLLLKRQT